VVSSLHRRIGATEVRMNFGHLLAILISTAIAAAPVASAASVFVGSGDELESPTVLAVRRGKTKRPRPSAAASKERIAKLPLASRKSDAVRIRQRDGAMAASLRNAKGLSRRAARKEARHLRRKQDKRVEKAFHGS
jgi:hypothetical protein